LFNGQFKQEAKSVVQDNATNTFFKKGRA